MVLDGTEPINGWKKKGDNWQTKHKSLTWQLFFAPGAETNADFYDRLVPLGLSRFPNTEVMWRLVVMAMVLTQI